MVNEIYFNTQEMIFLTRYQMHHVAEATLSKLTLLLLTQRFRKRSPRHGTNQTIPQNLKLPYLLLCSFLGASLFKGNGIVSLVSKFISKEKTFQKGIIK